MKHFLIEGFVQEVPADFAARRLESGAWYRCDAEHTLNDHKQDAQTETVYHKAAEGQVSQ